MKETKRNREEDAEKKRRRRKTVEAGDTNTFRIGIWRIGVILPGSA